MPKNQRNPSGGSARPQGQQIQKVHSVTATRQEFQGPIPPPAILEGYEHIVLGSADRILKMAESETIHRHAMERSAVDANIVAQQRQLGNLERQTKSVFRSDVIGQLLGCIVSLTCVLGAIYLAISGQPAVGAALVALPFVGIIRALRGMPKPPQKPDK